MSAAYTQIYFIKKVLEPYKRHQPSIGVLQKYLIELLRMVVKNSHFDFNGRQFNQIAGTAMGTKLAPCYAKLFVSSFEDKSVYIHNPNNPSFERGSLMTCFSLGLTL